MFWEIFLVGSFWFWLLFVGLLVLIELSVMHENHSGFLWVLLFCGIIWLLGNFNPFLWAWKNPWELVVDAGIYLAIGLVWGMAKWFFHLHNVKDGLRPWLDNKKQDYAKAQTREREPFVGSFTDFLEMTGDIPVAKHNKNLISVWMVWWPFSLAYTMFADVVRRFYHWLMDRYMVVFESINKAVFRDLN